jgi:hypothetical protein
MFNVARVGVVVAFAALGCGGTAVESGNGTGDGNAPEGAGRDDAPSGGPLVSAAGGPSSTYEGPYDSAGGAPAYGGNYSVGGIGGLTGDAGEAGLVGMDSDCSTPSPSPPLAAWEPETSPDEPVGQLLADARTKLTGSWRGVVDSPFVPPYSIVMSFRADGSYSAHCSAHSDYDGSSPGCCRALYYGTDQDSSLKQWTLTTADASGKTSGDLDIVFGYSGEFGESSYQGKISELELDATGNRARFNFLYGDRMAGTYDLERTP